MKPRFELAQIVRDYGNDFVQKMHPLKIHQKALHAIEICRTAALGGHVDRCSDCNHERIAYNSCRNRHCPKCQNTNRERWILERQNDLLPCTYFHVVFTLPHEVNSFCQMHPKEIYNMLFFASKETLLVFGNDPKHLGAQMGMIAILHTWGQNLSLHPHVHLIVPSGGFTKDSQWKNTRSNGEFLFPLRAVSMVFRGKFMENFCAFLKKINTPLDKNVRQLLYKKNWVVYAKNPFLGSGQVIEYLGRYSHKIAISNHRLTSIQNGKVSFTYKDYKHGATTKIMTLDANEFLRRFCLHILPPRFVKIRHYGFMASRVKQKLKMHQFKTGIITPKIKHDYKNITKEKLNFDIEKCPCCKTGKMIRVMTFNANAPPIIIHDKRMKKIIKSVC